MEIIGFARMLGVYIVNAVEKEFSLGRRPETQSYFCYRSKPHLTLEYLTPKPDFVSYWSPHLSLPEAVCHSKYALTFSTQYL